MNQISSALTVVLTGGPGGGKSALLERAAGNSILGPLVVILEEAIHALRGCRLSPRSVKFQCLLVQRQMEREKDALRVVASECRASVVTHRGSLDPCAFWQSFGNTRESFFEMTNTTLKDHYQRYGMVLHLESAVVLVPEAYQKWPDAHRPEEIAEAARLDALLAKLWSGRTNYHRISGTPHFEGKMSAALECLRRWSATLAFP